MRLLNKAQLCRMNSDIGIGFMDIGKLLFGGFVLTVAISDLPYKIVLAIGGLLAAVGFMAAGVWYGVKSEGIENAE
ncbi:MAG: hypothetical protein LBR16_02960 [Treponema sp.]|nr:hypothetical protein [Treponema sp.]